MTETETIIFPPHGGFKVEPEDDHDAFNSTSQASIASKMIMLRLQELFESWEMKDDYNFDYNLTHLEINNEIVVKIAISKSNFSSYTQSKVKSEEENDMNNFRILPL